MLVDATTFAPIEWTSSGSGGKMLRFTVYEKLPSTAENEALASLTAQHPDARIDGDQADYEAAELRLSPQRFR